MRMRRNPDAVAYLDEAKCLIEPEGMAGKWKEKLGGKALHVEIGTGKGGYSLELAKMHPDEAFIAVERNDTAAGLAARRYDEEACPIWLSFTRMRAQLKPGLPMEKWMSFISISPIPGPRSATPSAGFPRKASWKPIKKFWLVKAS